MHQANLTERDYPGRKVGQEDPKKVLVELSRYRTVQQENLRKEMSQVEQPTKKTMRRDSFQVEQSNKRTLRKETARQNSQPREPQGGIPFR
jgi:hypothetical protein